jgi:hypothetical protein
VGASCIGTERSAAIESRIEARDPPTAGMVGPRGMG